MWVKKAEWFAVDKSKITELALEFLHKDTEVAAAKKDAEVAKKEAEVAAAKKDTEVAKKEAEVAAAKKDTEVTKKDAKWQWQRRTLKWQRRMLKWQSCKGS